MKYLCRIQRAFETVIGTEGALTVVEDADIESVDGWDSQSFIPLILALENEFKVDISTIDAASLYSVKSISEYLNTRIS